MGTSTTPLPINLILTKTTNYQNPLDNEVLATFFTNLPANTGLRYKETFDGKDAQKLAEYGIVIQDPVDKPFHTVILYEIITLSNVPPRYNARYEHPPLIGYPHGVTVHFKPGNTGTTSQKTEVID